jgi:hypothetical protein
MIFLHEGFAIGALWQNVRTRALLLGAILLAFTSLGSTARAASSAIAPVQNSAALVFAEADEASELIETLRDGAVLSPIAESTGPGGVKWFMVKTRSGNVGWIKANANSEAERMDSHFRSLPRETISVGPASSTPEPASKMSATGTITIPIKMNGPRVVVPVTVMSGNSSSTGILLVDTGASQTMISKRMATEIRLLAIDSQTRIGIGGSIVVDVGRVESVKVGDAEVKNMRVSIHDRGYDFRTDGLLGFDFLGRFQMSVDADKQVMVLTPRKK